MIGRAVQDPNHAAEGVLPVAYDQRIPVLYGPQSFPLANADQNRGMMAGPATYGRGLLSVSNKASEVNIGNMPVFFVRQQLATLKQARQTRRVISRPIGGP